MLSVCVVDARMQSHPQKGNKNKGSQKDKANDNDKDLASSLATTQTFSQLSSLLIKDKTKEKIYDHTYSEAILDHLQVHTHEYGGVYRNPFRDKYSSEERLVPYAGHQTGFTAKHMSKASDNLASGIIKGVVASQQATENREKKNISATTYRKPCSRVRQLGSYSMLVSADDANDNTFQATKVPSKKEVLESLADASKRALIAYDVRIVETGALLKALCDIRHPTPGMAAIMDLHKAFVQGTATNPDPWNLTREQMQNILHNRVPWLAPVAVQRLISSYDPNRTGVVRYIRICCALVLCIRPAMSDLIALQSKLKALRAGKSYEELYCNSEEDGTANGTYTRYPPYPILASPKPYPKTFLITPSPVSQHNL